MQPVGLYQEFATVSWVWGKKASDKYQGELCVHLCCLITRLQATGKTNYSTIENEEQKIEPLIMHFEFLQNLGEVRVMRVVSTLVDGMINYANLDSTWM